MQVNVGKNIVLEIDHAALPQAALEHAIMIGLRNILMDSHASITATEYPDAAEREEVARAVVDKKLAALMSGEVRVAGTRASRDPVQAEIERITMSILVAKIRKAGKKAKDYEPSALKAAAAKLVTDEIRAQAQARVAEMAKSVPDTDLSELGL